MARVGIATSDNNQQYYNRLALFVALPTLFIFSILFCTERLYGDSADYLFRIIQDNGFRIAHNRPSSVFVEWLPVLMVKLKLPLSYILYGFSIAEFGYFFVWYLLFTRVFKAPIYGFGVLLAYTFGLRWNYFNPVSELILSFPFTFLLAHLWGNTPKNKTIWYAASLVIAMFVLMSHPLYLLFIPALFGYFYLNNLKERRFIYLGICIVVLLVVNYLLLAGYNKLSMETAQYEMKPGEIIRKFLSISSIEDLVKAYAGIFFLLALLVFGLFKDKKKVQLVFVIGFVLGFFGLVAHKYGGYYPDTFEPFERYLFIVTLFICILALPYLLQAKIPVKHIVTVLMVWHLFYLGKYGVHVKHRYDVLAVAITNAAQFGTNKVYYRAENYYSIMGSPRERGHDWIMPTESLMLTSINGPQHTRQVFVKETVYPGFYDIIDNNNYMYNFVGWLGNVKDLNPTYFQLKPSPWVEANSDSAQVFDPVKIKYEIPGIIHSIKVNQELKLPIVLTNTGAPLYSGMKNQRRGLGYRWKGNKTYNGSITPLMCDLLTSSKQELVITGPAKTGDYTLEIGYMAEKPDTFIPFGGPGGGYYIEAYK
jgi:hypothetical protein